MARHAVVDLAIVFDTPPVETKRERLSPAELAHLRSTLAASGLRLREESDADEKLTELRVMYEPYLYSLSKYFRIAVPPWIHASSHPDNWQLSVWKQPSRPSRKREAGHF
jgi:hypothetical protein